MQTANDIRRTFLDYFRKEGHEIVPSSPLVPRNDPTLMFTNAGMVQFKNVFTGAEKRDYVRAATAQKCVRAGGKHNDLENVGYTARHHTFFEMLGNFSFGDYFKERAIDLAWRLITKEFGLSKDKLLVTVYHQDDEAFGLWQKIAGLSDDRIIRIPTSDNFWAMGDTGPCGPCSEIFYDHGSSIPGGPPGSPDEDGDRFIEIWNLVFMQFEQLTKDERVNLPRPSIDTGMGLERLAAVLQGKHDNYDIDLMRALIEASAAASGTDPDGPLKVSHRVIADHLRSCSFLVADGVLPANEGRGYVLRRIMRRAMRHAHKLGCQEPLMWRLVPALIAQMGQAYPELIRAEAVITETFKLEESRFKQMLDRGLRLLDDETSKLGQGQKLSGDGAFKLYDTFGFPLDLTEDILRGQDRSVDKAGFDAAMERQRETARKAWSGSGEAATEAVWFNLREKLGASDFLGYATERAEGQIIGMLKNGQEIEKASAGDEIALIANQTPFYGESGGQMGDTGTIVTAGGGEIAVGDTLKKLGDMLVHFGKVTRGTVSRGEAAEFKVDGKRRAALRAHHSATHLLHEALRRRLGAHVTQKGSLVAPDRLRFDFSHPRALSSEDIAAVEQEVNDRIRKNAPVETHLMTPDAAIEAGALALFGEKYGEEVRVVSMGGRHEDEAKNFSTELCGGTHVRRTGDIGLFKIVSEGAVASGVRRIEAMTGAAAEAYVAEQQRQLNEAAAALKTLPGDLASRIVSLVEEKKKLERDLTEARKAAAIAGAGGGNASTGTKDVNGVAFAARVLKDVPAKELKGMADELKKQIGSGVVVLISDDAGKASIVVGVTSDLTGKVSAVDLVKTGSAALGGQGGGGRPDMAQAGGPDASKAEDALSAIEKAIGGTAQAA
ncbi:alanine--tRNA ligase [Dongia soli]|uniref:Alanine--tRNA ligase n=1 Tax=Dongia soli TaxID=600628 RepID=A0ABU5E8J7_9PROT|nr:alanine--tRNA ligase [Dongia soli]MDY0882685.1 alanine--tRNA ligase [Dongia soli]